MTADTNTKVLVITGASKGIGFATAERFQKEGFKIVNISRSPISLAGSVQIGADLCDPNWGNTVRNDLENAVAGAEKIVLVHNAALQAHDTATGLEADQFRRILEINLVAPITLNAMLADKMPRGSAVIYIGSTLSLKAIANTASYATTKHALVGLMRSTCQDLAGTGIHTACVCPGFTNTEMLQGFGQETLDQLAQRSTQNRLLEPHEIAETIYFCALNSAVNGTVLRADSGLVEI